MMKNLLTLVCLFISINISVGQSALEMALFEMPDIIFKKIDTPKGFESAYELKIKQPLDHTDPSKGHFYQRAFLSHKGYENPTAIITNGYGKSRNNITEVAQLLDANQINIEHRFFLESSPEEIPYEYLNFKQVTADLHKINQVFRSIYKGKWISTGISKGGTTTIFYRYFYPDDVDVSIPYVAPVNHSNEDPRIYKFLNEKGSKECRKAIFEFQKRMLTKSEDVKALLKWYAKGKGLKFNYLNLDEAYEFAILEYPFSFWQYGHDCQKIPTEKDDIEKHIEHFLALVGLDFYSDADMESYASHYYQSGTEMGYYGYETEKFKGLLKYLPSDPHPSAIFAPNKMDITFDGTLTNKVFEWAKTADNIVYINGALDTWSATAVPPCKSCNSLFYFLDNKHHANARIKSMNADEKTLLVKTLNKWLDITITDEKETEK